jgi:hypothetical protein
MDDEKIQQQVKETLDLLVSSPQMKPRPFFYTRLKARMDGRTATGHHGVRVLHPGMYIAVVAVALLVALNAYSLAWLSTESSKARAQDTAASFAQDYGLTVNHY